MGPNTKKTIKKILTTLGGILLLVFMGVLWKYSGIGLTFPSISFTVFLVTLLVGMVVIIALSIMLGTILFFGKELKPYKTAKLKKQAMFQIYSIDHSLRLEPVKEIIGGGFKQLKEHAKAIFPRSTYTVDGVKTVLLYDLFPEQNPDIIEGLELLTKRNITTLNALEEHVDKLGREDEIFIKDYTYSDFIKILSEVQNKYTIEITVSDVIDFLDKHSNQHFSKSLAQRDINQAKKKRTDPAAKKYAFYIIMAWVGVLLGILVYKVVG